MPKPSPALPLCPSSRALGNGLTQTFNYYDWNEQALVDGEMVGQGGRLETLTTGTLQNLGYLYDAVGNVKQIVDSEASETSTYQYDDLNRLRFWTLNGVTEEYSYDAAGNLDVKNGLDLEYEDTDHIHAVTHIGATQKYWYDDNGNQVTRIVGPDTYTQIYDAENRMVEVKKNGTTMARFDYNGDGQRVKSVIGDETILFVGGHFEQKGNEVTKYYFAGASRIAMRKVVVPQTNTLTYLIGDHLGSTSLAVDASTGSVVETRYKPWGEVRFTSENMTLPTRYTFTGQYSYVSDEATDLGNAGFGLMFYNARWYDSTTGRFAQADTVVPGGVQGLDRYAYVNNSPVRYNDPSGHDPWWCDDEDDPEKCRQDYYEAHHPPVVTGTITLTSTSALPETPVLGFSKDDILAINTTKKPGDIITYENHGVVSQVVFVTDPNGNLVLLNVETMTTVLLEDISPFGLGFYHYNVETGAWDIHVGVGAWTSQPEHIRIKFPDRAMFGWNEQHVFSWGQTYGWSCSIWCATGLLLTGAGFVSAQPEAIALGVLSGLVGIFDGLHVTGLDAQINPRSPSSFNPNNPFPTPLDRSNYRP